MSLHKLRVPALVLALGLACAKIDAPPAGGLGSGGRTIVNAGSGGSFVPPPGQDGGQITVEVGGMDACGEFMFNPTAKTALLMLVLDRSGSMKEPLPNGQAKWAVTTTSLDAAINGTQKTVRWGMKTFPNGSADCAIATGVDVAAAEMNYTTMSNAIKTTTPDGNGTPTGDGVKAGLDYLRTVTTTDPKYILLATDGDPTCGTPDGISYAVAQVEAARALGIFTFVIGLGTGSKSGFNLDKLALAGGRARPVTNPLDSKYYPADSPDELVTTLRAITGQIASCVFDLGRPPPDQQFVNVTLGGIEIPYDVNGQNGWTFAPNSTSVITVAGAACSQIQESSDGVKIVFGCKPPIIP